MTPSPPFSKRIFKFLPWPGTWPVPYSYKNLMRESNVYEKSQYSIRRRQIISRLRRRPREPGGGPGRSGEAWGRLGGGPGRSGEAWGANGWEERRLGGQEEG